MAKIVRVLYDDPVAGPPKTYARDKLPKLKSYPDGQTLPTPAGKPPRGSECSASGVEAYHLPAGDEDVSQTDLIASRWVPGTALAVSLT
jgi:hypothetical protein